jgi:hypothetical protein
VPLIFDFLALQRKKAEVVVFDQSFQNRVFSKRRMLGFGRYDGAECPKTNKIQKETIGSDSSVLMFGVDKSKKFICF